MVDLQYELTALPMPPLDKMPARFTIPPEEIGGRSLEFVLNYNGWNPSLTPELSDPLGDFFTLIVWRSPITSEKDRIVAVKLVYAQDVLKPEWHHPELMGIRMVPMDIGLQEGKITRENFGKTVFIYYKFDLFAYPGVSG